MRSVLGRSCFMTKRHMMILIAVPMAIYMRLEAVEPLGSPSSVVPATKAWASAGWRPSTNWFMKVVIEYQVFEGGCAAGAAG